MSDNPLDVTKAELEAAGIPYEVEHGKRHFKVKFSLGGRTRMAVCSGSASDKRATANARQTIRREIRQGKADEKE